MAAELLVRWVHVLGMAAVVGGAMLTWGLFRDGPPRQAAAAYEAVFWAGAGLLVATGVGNLGALAPAIPAAGTPWGHTLAVKLVAVVGLLVGSAVRTLAVVRWLGAADGTMSPAIARRLAGSYAATVGYLLLLVALAVVLAHG